MDNGTTIAEPVVGKTELYDVRIRSQMDSYENKLAKLAYVQLKKLKDRIFVDVKSIFDVKKAVIQDSDIYTLSNLDLSELEGVLPLAAEFQQELILSTFGGKISNLKAFVGLNFNLKPDPILFRASLTTRQEYLKRVVTKFTLKRVNKIIETGIADGSSYTEIARRMEESGLFSRARAERIARTESNRALNEGTRQYVDMLGVTQYKISPARDACEVCIEASKKTYSIQQQDILPIHTNCRCTLISVIPEDWIRKGFADSATVMKESIEKLQQQVAKSVPIDIDVIKQEIREGIKDGKTPVKGTDYFTQEEIDEFKQKLLNDIPKPKNGKTPKKGVDYFTQEEIGELKQVLIDELKTFAESQHIDNSLTTEELQQIEENIVSKIVNRVVNEDEEELKAGDIVGLREFVTNEISKIQLLISTPVAVNSLNDMSGDLDLVAGTNVTLTKNTTNKTITISSTGGSGTPVWGAITGDIENQTDLVTYVQEAAAYQFIYNFTDATSANVAHNMGKYPAVSLIDSAGTEYQVEVQHLDLNNTIVSWQTTLTGKIIFN